jgi:hypothetical protein
MGNLRKIFVGEIKENYKFSKCWSTHIKGITGWMSYEEALLLFEVARIISERRENFLMVEIGSYEGKSSVALASGLSADSFLMCVDPHTGDRSEVDAGKTVSTYQNFEKNINLAGLKDRVIPVIDESTKAALKFEFNDKYFGGLFIDVWHSTEAVAQDIDSWVSKMSKVQTIIFDDFTDIEVMKGIKSRKDSLPKFLGDIGKISIYTNDLSLRNSKYGKYLARKRRFEMIKFIVQKIGVK